MPSAAQVLHGLFEAVAVLAEERELGAEHGEARADDDFTRSIFRSTFEMPFARTCGDDCARTRITIIDLSAMRLCE